MIIHSANTQEIIQRIAQLQALSERDVGRGIQPLVKVTQGEFLGAASSIVNHPLPHIPIITGLVCNSKLSINQYKSTKLNYYL